MKTYKIKYKRNKRICLVKIVKRHDRILDAIERNKNGFELIVSAEYDLEGEG